MAGATLTGICFISLTPSAERRRVACSDTKDHAQQHDFLPLFSATCSVPSALRRLCWPIGLGGWCFSP